MSTQCHWCGRPRGMGSHELGEAERRALPPSFCPKCSGGPDDAYPRCADDTTYFYKCGCGVEWTAPRSRTE